MTQIPNVLEIAQQKQRESAAIQMEIRKVAIDLYARLAGDYLSHLGHEDCLGLPSDPSPDELRKIAWTCHKAAPYLHQEFGMCNINEEEHWKK